MYRMIRLCDDIFDYRVVIKKSCLYMSTQRPYRLRKQDTIWYVGILKRGLNSEVKTAIEFSWLRLHRQIFKNFNIHSFQLKMIFKA